MALFVLSDPHLSLGCDKPMDVFGGWQNYVERLSGAWKRLVAPTDTVVLPGDISWAMKLEHCTEDFRFLQQLPGRKILGKGNHDYWWTTMNKMQTYLAQNAFDTLSFLFNNAPLYDDLALCGTRSWFFDGKQEHDEKILNRELGRWRLPEIGKSWYSCIIRPFMAPTAHRRFWICCSNTTFGNAILGICTAARQPEHGRERQRASAFGWYPLMR